MKKALFILFAAFISIIGLAQTTAPHMVQNLDAKINAAELSTSGGFIQVLHEANVQPRLEVHIRGNNDKQLTKEEIGQRLQEDYDLTIETIGTKVVAKAKRKSNYNQKNSLSISFKLYAPEKMDTKLATSGGSITLSGLSGKQEFATSGGGINVSRMKGELDGATSGGSINIDHCSASIEMATSGGGINASDCKGEIDLKTSGGSLKLTNLDGNIEAATSGGSVEASNIAGELEVATSGGSMRLTDMKCTLDAATSAGSMKVEITTLGKYVKLHNSGGSIHLSVPANKGMNLALHGNNVEVNALNNFSGSHTGKEVKGKLNGGGVEVTAKTSGGKVSLEFH